MSEHFTTVIVCDFEYEIADGELPDVLCMVAHVLDANLQHAHTIRLWRGEFGTAPPFDIGADTLFVAYSAWAEMTCFMVLGWKFPDHVFDLHTAYLAASNILLPHNPDEVRKRPRKRLADACRAYGVAGWEQIDKEVIARDIGEGRWRDHGQESVFNYCEGGRPRFRVAARPAIVRAHRIAAGQRRPRAVLVELQRQGGRKDSSPGHADRRAAVEPGAGEQGRGHRRAAAAI